MFLPLVDYEKTPHIKNWQSVCRTWLCLAAVGKWCRKYPMLQAWSMTCVIRYSSGKTLHENPFSQPCNDPRQQSFWDSLPLTPIWNKWVSTTHHETFVWQCGDPLCIGFWDIMYKNKQTNSREKPPLHLLSGKSQHRSCAWDQERLRGSVVERRSSAGVLSLSCARPVADEWTLMWVNRPLWVNQPGQLSLSSLWGR